MSSASDTPRFPAGPGEPTRPAVLPTRRARALPSGESPRPADGGEATEEGGPGAGYQVPGAVPETPANPPAGSWFTPRGQQQPQGPGQGQAKQGDEQHAQQKKEDVLHPL